MTPKARKRISIAANVGMIAVMLSLVAYSPTLYRWFCAATGYGGTVQRATGPVPTLAAVNKAPSDRILVTFDSNVAPGLDWEFRPEQTEVEVQVGVPTQISYYAKNLSDHPIVAHAVYNVTPYTIAPYFYKIECFCFTDEKLDPGEEAHMPVVFYIDQSMLDDAQARGYGRVTLSYTFFGQKPTPEKLDAARALNAGSKDEAEAIKAGEPAAFDNDAPRS
jgi:cytochrome c oxidase assembly protein subunit 11